MVKHKELGDPEKALCIAAQPVICLGMVNVSLDDSVARALSAKAAAEGLSMQAYLEAIATSDQALPASTMSPEDFDRFLDQEATHGPSPIGTFSRAELYSDHD